MAENTIVEQLEAELRLMADAATLPRGAECLACYIARMLDDFGCDNTLRWARRFRDVRSPTATGLERRLGTMGGFCDCEIFLNCLEMARHVLVRDVHTDELEAPAQLPTCAGVRRTSTRWCVNWERQPRR